jgi:hypothetical protein
MLGPSPSHPDTTLIARCDDADLSHLLAPRSPACRWSNGKRIWGGRDHIYADISKRARPTEAGRLYIQMHADRCSCWGGGRGALL